MTWLQIIILSLTQGLTEFLPVSSSGHLALWQNWWQINPVPVEFDLFLHLSSLVAVVIFFWSDLTRSTWKTWLRVGLATLPALIIGGLLANLVNSAFGSVLMVGVGLLITAAVNLITDWQLKKKATSKTTWPTINQSLLIGLAQGLAIFPGVSRSGMTMMAANSVNLKPAAAYTFSFLISIPIITAANIWGQFFLDQPLLNLISLPQAMVAASLTFGFSWLSLIILKELIDHRRYGWFSGYCAVLGLAVIFFSWPK